MQEIAAQLGVRVRERRQALNLSQQILATNAGLATGTLARIEAGDGANLSTIAAIAGALGCPITDLLAEKETK